MLGFDWSHRIKTHADKKKNKTSIKIMPNSKEGNIHLPLLPAAVMKAMNQVRFPIRKQSGTPG